MVGMCTLWYIHHGGYVHPVVYARRWVGVPVVYARVVLVAILPLCIWAGIPPWVHLLHSRLIHHEQAGHTADSSAG